MSPEEHSSSALKSNDVGYRCLVFGFEGMTFRRVDFVEGKTGGFSKVRRSRTFFLDSSMVEHSAVNRVVVGSSPTRGVFFFFGSMVKRLRHRPFTAVTRVQIPSGSLLIANLNELAIYF